VEDRPQRDELQKLNRKLNELKRLITLCKLLILYLLFWIQFMEPPRDTSPVRSLIGTVLLACITIALAIVYFSSGKAWEEKENEKTESKGG